MEDKVFFLPLLEIDGAFCKKFNQIAGKHFDSNGVSIHFNGICNQTPLDEELLLLRIDNVGINGEFYISYPEVRRMLKVDITLLDPLYIEYVFTRSVGSHGIKFMRYITASEQHGLPPLVMTAVQLLDSYYAVLCDIQQLNIEPEYLRGRKSYWPGSLKLSLDMIVTETLLDTHDIINLSDEDVILLSDK
ncbi:TPA: hypothetical protein ACQ301_004422 [Yersinia enterocolitica]